MDYTHHRKRATSIVCILPGVALLLLLAGGCNSRAGRDVTQAGTGGGSDTVQVDSGGGGRTLLISPRSGPPGTRVRLVGSGYEPNALLDIGVGPVDSEYEIIDSVRAGGAGELDTTVVIHATASDSARYVFVVAGPQAQWKVISDPFIITSEPMSNEPGASVTVRGTLTDEGVECQAMRGEDGSLYTLTGDLGGFKTGDRVRVEGVVAEVSYCQQGTTINVSRIEAI